MKKLLMVLVLCLFLPGCASYSSSNLIRTQGGKSCIFWGTGFLTTENASVTIYRNSDATVKNKKDYPDLPDRPVIQESGQGGQVNIGKSQKLTPVAPAASDNNSVVGALVGAVAK